MAIGAQGYSLGRAIRTLLDEVLDVMYFKKWQTIDLERCVRATDFANVLASFSFKEHTLVESKNGANNRCCRFRVIPRGRYGGVVTTGAKSAAS